MQERLWAFSVIIQKKTGFHEYHGNLSQEPVFLVF